MRWALFGQMVAGLALGLFFWVTFIALESCTGNSAALTVYRVWLALGCLYGC